MFSLHRIPVSGIGRERRKYVMFYKPIDLYIKYHDAG